MAEGLQEALFDQTPKDEWLPIGELLESLRSQDGHQRPLNKAHAATIAKDFDPKSVGRLVVNRRADGVLWLIDGQHRAYAMRQLGLELALCSVYEGLTPAEEAEVWVKRNGGALKARTFDEFRGKTTYDAEVQEIVRVVNACGYHIPQSDSAGWGNPRAINAVGALRDIHRYVGTAGLADVLTTLRKAWPNDPHARSSEMMLGMHVFLAVYRKEMKRDRLEKRLAVTPLDDIVRQATAMRGLFSTKRASLLALALVEAYNYKLKADQRLDPAKVAQYSHKGGAVSKALLRARAAS